MKNFENKEKIVKVSEVLRIILLGILALWALAVLMFFFDIVFPLFAFPKERLYSSTTLILVGNMGLTSLAFYMFLQLYRFFDRLRSGHLFDAETVGYLCAAGKLWIVRWICEELFVIFILHKGAGFRPDTMNWDFGDLFAGVMLIFVAWLLREGQELKEEQALTV
jgi:hypothetical protein